MKNNITNWTYEKPTEEGLYLAYDGEVETSKGVIAFRFVTEEFLNGEFYCGLPAYSESEITTWHPRMKFARLCVGSECDE